MDDIFSDWLGSVLSDGVPVTMEAPGLRYVEIDQERVSQLTQSSEKEVRDWWVRLKQQLPPDALLMPQTDKGYTLMQVEADGVFLPKGQLLFASWDWDTTIGETIPVIDVTHS